MKPVQLAPNLIDHFYRGGARIAALRGLPAAGERQPEEWIAATVSRFGEGDTGLARTVDGELLRDLVAADPAGWLGAGPAAALASLSGGDSLSGGGSLSGNGSSSGGKRGAEPPVGGGSSSGGKRGAEPPVGGDSSSGGKRGAEPPVGGDTGMLLKLLDAGQRLPVHVHPDREFARSHLGCPYGKTEAWVVLDADPGAAVHLGWREDVDAAELATRRDAQDGAWMLERMHRIEVSRGDGILVPAGTVHAIGAGVFVLEAQEPTDFSILLEWSVTTETRDGSHLGLGFDTAMGAVDHHRLDEELLRELVSHVDLDGPGPARCLVEPAETYFRVDLAGTGVPVPSGFAALIVLGGDGALTGAGGSVALAAGQAWAVPAGFGDWTVTGQARVLAARPGRNWPADLVGVGAG